MTVDEKLERAYLEGEAQAARAIVNTALRYLKAEDPIVKMAYLEAELSEARSAARSLCEELGLEYPGDDLNLADVIEKHIGRAIDKEGV